MPAVLHGRSSVISPDAFIQAIPDLILFVRRDGVLLGYGGGKDVPSLCPTEDCVGKPLESHRSESTAAFIRRAVRKAIESRAPHEARFEELEDSYELRATAQGPDRAVCVIRARTRTDPNTTAEHGRPHLDRRGFLGRFKESLSIAALRESPLAVVVIHIEGLAEVAQTMMPALSEQILSTALLRLMSVPAAGETEPRWYLGQLSETLLALVFESADRQAIERCVGRVCAGLRQPVEAAGVEFHLNPHAGAAVLGQDASSPKALLEHARTAAAEARRSGSNDMHFFSDSLRLKSLARLDLARELREAIDNRHIRLRYVGRYDLLTGRLVSWVGYLRWMHPLRGEIRPAEFLRVAETTGLATALSRAALSCLRVDFPRLCADGESEAYISFGALRHHVLHEGFAADIEEFLAEGSIPADRLELRIAEKTLIARPPAYFNPLQRLNVRLVVDEMGRGLGSVDWLARAPLWGLQLDRAWVTALCKEPVARRVCRAGIAVAAALGITPIATGVDNQEQRQALIDLGCRYGSGDFYHSVDVEEPIESSSRLCEIR